ncbi:MAG: YceI family protein, partial [Thermonemataceae bacterium]|nr:YceI family protein [Thermonemataceae bacterium]
AEVIGFFKDFQVKLYTDKADFSDVKVEAHIKANSIFTNMEARDKHLMSSDFLEVEQFPEIRFVSNAIKKVAEKKYELTGRLTIRDITLTTTLEVEHTGVQKDPWGNTKAGFKAHTIIKRTLFGLTWNNILENGAWLVGNDIKMSFQGEFIRLS